MNPLVQLESAGQSPWLDDLHRDLVRKGELKRMIEEEGLKGRPRTRRSSRRRSAKPTNTRTNCRPCCPRGSSTTWPSTRSLAVDDIQGACDVFRPVYDKTGKHDGFVSLEVSPTLANETDGTIADAKRLWKTVGRENLMVKVPGTKAGVPAIKAVDRRRHQHQRHAAVRHRGLRGRGRGLHFRPRAAREDGRRPVQGCERRELLPEPDRHGRRRQGEGLDAAKQAEGAKLRTRSPSPTPNWLTRAASGFLPARAGMRWRPRARSPSVCSGHRPAPRIRPCRRLTTSTR